MNNTKEWLTLVKAKAVLIKLFEESSSCEDCANTLLNQVDDIWIYAGREINEEMAKYEEIWIESYLERNPPKTNNGSEASDGICKLLIN